MDNFESIKEALDEGLCEVTEAPKDEHEVK